MSEKILIPLDGSQLAETALPYGEELGGRLGSEITLLSVAQSAQALDYHKHQVYADKSGEQTEHEAGKYLEQTKNKVIRVKSAVLVGNPASEIVQYAEREHISLIIMATHGRSGITRWALGSVADKVVRAAKQPIALIRAKGRESEVQQKGILDRILVPLDGSRESEAVLSYIEEFASRLKAKVTLLQAVPKGYHLLADAEGYLKNVADLLRSKGVEVRNEVRTGAPAEEIIKFAEETSTDLVAMSTHGRSGIGRWALGSVADRVLHAGTTPLLLVRTAGQNEY